MAHDIKELRKHLFETLDAIRDEKNPMALDRAKAVADVSQTIINSAKVEVDFLKATGGMEGSGFIPDGPSGQLPGPPLQALPGKRGGRRGGNG